VPDLQSTEAVWYPFLALLFREVQEGWRQVVGLWGKKKITDDERAQYSVRYWVYVNKGWPGEHLEEGSDTFEGAVKIAERFQHVGSTRIKEQLERTVKSFPKTAAEPLQ
jgi:hypothetical protein